MTTPSLFRHRNFSLLFGADTISQIGTQVSTLALPLVAVLALHASPFETGLLAAAQTAAFLLVGLPAGVWVDRMPRRRILVGADVVRAVLLASVPLAWWFDALSLPQLYGVALGTGLATVFFDVAYQSYLPSLVGRDRLMEGNAKLEIVRNSAQIAGPAVGGGLIQLLTAPVAVVLDAVSFLGSALMLGRIDATEQVPDRSERRGLLKEIGEGLRYVVSHRILRLIAASTALANFANGMMVAVEMIFLARVVGLSPGAIGVLFSVVSVGGLTGAALVGPMSRRIGSARIIWLSIMVTSPFTALVPLTEPGWRVSLFAIGAFIQSIGVVLYNVGQVTFRQSVTPERMLGRMNATMRFLVWGTLPIGGLVGGLLGEQFGARATLWVVVGVTLLAVVPPVLSPLRTMRDLPEVPDPDGPGTEGPAAGPMAEQPAAEEPAAGDPAAEGPPSGRPAKERAAGGGTVTEDQATGEAAAEVPLIGETVAGIPVTERPAPAHDPASGPVPGSVPAHDPASDPVSGSAPAGDPGRDGTSVRDDTGRPDPADGS
ncbi:MFS transporter [Streptosporangium sp. NPDC048047]|uniref:MFS transporter n=1 Tax=Streptosporangium sp. NPDC048047 TaxID=3155748 RepID=UPI00342E7CBE